MTGATMTDRNYVIRGVGWQIFSVMVAHFSSSGCCWIEVRKSGELAIYFESSNFGHMELIDWLPFLRWGHFGNYTYGPKMVTHFKIGGKWTTSHPFASCFIHMAIFHAYCPITFRITCRGKLRWQSLIAHLKNGHGYDTGTLSPCIVEGVNLWEIYKNSQKN